MGIVDLLPVLVASLFFSLFFISVILNLVQIFLLIRTFKELSQTSQDLEESLETQSVDRAIVSNLTEILEAITEYGSQLQEVSELELYTGEPIIENIINNTRILVKDIENYSMISSQNSSRRG